MEILAKRSIDEYVIPYVKHIDKKPDFYAEDEGYKYRAVSTFRREFDLHAADLAGMLEKAFKRAHNLVQSGNYFPKKMLLIFAKKDSGFVRRELKKLLSPKPSVDVRIDEFVAAFKNKFHLKKGKHTFFDTRFASFFLGCYDPNKYFYVKETEFRKFARKVHCDFDFHHCSRGQKYLKLAKFGSMVREHLRQNPLFRKAHSLIADRFEYKDPSMTWGTIDFIYNTIRISERKDKPIRKKALRDSEIADAMKDQAKDLFEGEEAGEKLRKELSESDRAKIEKEAKDYRPSAGKKKGLGKANVKRRKDDAAQKERIRFLENYRCQVCGHYFEYKTAGGSMRKYVEIDHIIEKSKGGTEVASNLWALCANCHVKKTLRVIVIDPKTKKVTDGGKAIPIRDNHLGWNKK